MGSEVRGPQLRNPLKRHDQASDQEGYEEAKLKVFLRLPGLP